MKAIKARNLKNGNKIVYNGKIFTVIKTWIEKRVDEQGRSIVWTNYIMPDGKIKEAGFKPATVLQVI